MTMDNTDEDAVRKLIDQLEGYRVAFMDEIKRKYGIEIDIGLEEGRNDKSSIFVSMRYPRAVFKHGPQRATRYAFAHGFTQARSIAVDAAQFAREKGYIR